jgi:hypothetical protein
VVELNPAKSSTASAVVEPFATQMTPDDRGYDKFNRSRGFSSQKFGMTHILNLSKLPSTYFLK